MQRDTDYRQFLREEWETRLARNPNYSLRAYARDLRTSAPALSEVLSRKRGISRSAAMKMASRLNWSPAKTNRFCDLVEAEHGRSSAARALAKHRLEAQARDEQSEFLTIDAFQTVSDWYHFGILAALKLPGVTSADQLARKLSISPTLIEEALKRLERLGLIEHVESAWRVVRDSVFSPDGVPSEAIRKAHEQLLNRAIEALYFQSLDERKFYAYIMPVCGADLAEIAARYEKFVLEIRDEFSTRPTVDRVVNLGGHIFGLSRPDSTTETSSLPTPTLEVS